MTFKAGKSEAHKIRGFHSNTRNLTSGRAWLLSSLNNGTVTHSAAIKLPQNMNQDQLKMLHNLEEFGWKLAFIRYSAHERAVVVLNSPEEKQYAILEEDGSLNLDPGLTFR